MKIQSLAVIFVLIILPISIVLSEYVKVQMDTLKLQTQYDSQLLSATYDAVSAFQKNTVNSNYSDITSSKMRDIEASANVFLNSVANNFKMSGNSKDAIKEYIPAVVYTLYDGYYIYSPFYNKLEGINVDSNSSYQDGKRTFGLKPYIYYSKEYTDTGYDIVITYSLDNYITIQGKVTKNDGTNLVINESGYIIDINEITEGYDGSIYRGIQIKSGNNDEVYEYADKNSLFQCMKINGTKYYLDGEKVFYIVQNERRYLGDKTAEEYIEKYFTKNNQSREYYVDAYKFTQKILNEYGLSNLTASNGQKIFDTNAKNVEYYSSNFNQERREVIKNSIEKNLSSAIANFNNISETYEADFQMPKLQEDEWDKIINNISVISFLQGINMGTRPYNGYSIVTNNKNEEFVGEEAIYITTKNGEYHRINDSDLLEGTQELGQGVFNMNFERKAIDIHGDDGSTISKEYYYPRKELACYNSIVTQSGINPMETKLANGTKVPKTVYEYLDENKNKTKGMELASLYYTALGRERYGHFNINNNSSE